jgi:hypothetical protein
LEKSRVRTAFWQKCTRARRSAVGRRGDELQGLSAWFDDIVWGYPRFLDLQSKAPRVALRTSMWFGSLDVPDFQQEPDQRFLLSLEESSKDIADATEELANPVADCQDRFRWLKGKVVGLGVGSV